MNNKEFLAEISDRLGYTTKEATALVNAFAAEITAQLEDENTISINGFGTFEVRKKLERVVVNPTTKQRQLVPPKMVVNFKASPVMKDKMQSV